MAGLQVVLSGGTDSRAPAASPVMHLRSTHLASDCNTVVALPMAHTTLRVGWDVAILGAMQPRLVMSRAYSLTAPSS